MSAALTLQLAEALLEQPLPVMRGRWPRAVALLARQSLEQALDELWDGVAPGVKQATTRAQLLCLGTYLGDDEVAAAAVHTWGWLTRACHHHVYELAPSAGELRAALHDVAQVVAAIHDGDPNE